MTDPIRAAGSALVARGLTDLRSMSDIIWPGFQRDTGTSATLDYRQEVDMGRLRGTLEAGGPGDRLDVVVVANPRTFSAGGLLAAIDGLDHGAVPDAWRDRGGRAWPVYVQPIVAVYNAHRVAPPTGWADLADDRWRDRLVFEAAARMLTTGPALAELRSTLGVAAWEAWLTSLAELLPRQVADNERAVLEVATGSRWGGLSNWNVARRVRVGSPARHVFLDPTPCIPGFAAVVEGAASPVLAGAFVRWLVSPSGQRAYAATGRVPAAPPDGAAVTLESVLPRGVRPVLGTADWAHNPDPWVAAFEARLPIEGVAAAGKLRAD